MGMTIDESISELKWVRKVNKEILKTDAKEIDADSAWIKHWENVVKSLDVAIETMRKYQRIEQILKEPCIIPEGCYPMLKKIKRVVEDGENDN